MKNRSKSKIRNKYWFIRWTLAIGVVLSLITGLFTLGALNNSYSSANNLNKNQQVQTQSHDNDKQSLKPENIASANSSVGAPASQPVNYPPNSGVLFTAGNAFANINDLTRWLQSVEQNPSSVLGAAYANNTVFHNWAVDMLTGVIADGDSISSFFSASAIDPVLNSLNATNNILTNGDEINLTLPNNNLTMTTLSGAPTNTQDFNNTNIPIKVAQFNADDQGKQALAFSFDSTNNPSSDLKNTRLIIDNSNGQFQSVGANQDFSGLINDGSIFYRTAQSVHSPTSQDPQTNNTIFGFRKDQNEISVYAYLNPTGISASDSVKISQPNLAGSISKIDSFTYGVLGIGPNQFSSPSLSVAKPNIPIYSEQATPETDQPVKDKTQETFYMRANSELHLQVKSQGGAVILEDFEFIFDGKAVTYLGYTSKQITDGDAKLVIPDTIWDENVNQEGNGNGYKLDIRPTISNNGNFARVTMDWYSDAYDFTDQNAYINLNDGLSNFFYNGVFFEKPPTITFGAPPVTANKFSPQEEGDPNRIAKEAMGRVLEQWAGYKNYNFSLANNFTINYQSVTGSSSDPQNLQWDQSATDKSNLSGSDIYRVLNQQSQLERDVIKYLAGIDNNPDPSYIHGKNDDDDYYDLPKFVANSNKSSVDYLQDKVFNFVSESVSELPLQIVTKEIIDNNWQDVDQIPNDEYTSIEDNLASIMEGTIQKSFDEFILRVYQRVYVAYGKSLTENPQEQDAYTIPENLLKDVSGNRDNGTLLSRANGDATYNTDTKKPLVNSTINVSEKKDIKFNTEIIGSLVNFIKENDLVDAVFPDPQDRLDFAAIDNENSNDFINAQLFSSPDNSITSSQSDKSSQAFRLLSSLFSWLRAPVGDILSLALSPNVDDEAVAQKFRDAAQSAVENLFKTSETIDYHNESYQQNIFKVIVTNSNILSSLNRINLKDRSEEYLTNLELAKAADFRSFDLTRRYGNATENFDITKYSNYFSDGSKTQLYSDEITKLDFANPNIFAVPAPTPFVQKVLKESGLITSVIFLVTGISFIGVFALVQVNRRKIRGSSLATNKTSKSVIQIVSYSLLAMGLALSVIAIIYFSGGVGALALLT